MVSIKAIVRVKHVHPNFRLCRSPWAKLRRGLGDTAWKNVSAIGEEMPFGASPGVYIRSGGNNRAAPKSSLHLFNAQAVPIRGQSF
jgi:hypothetical protein